MNAVRTELCTVVLMALCGAAAAEDIAQKPVALKIAAQPVDHALKAFAEQTGLQVLFHVEGVQIPADLNSPSLEGSFTPEAALRQLLANTGLRHEFINARTVTIRALATTSGLEEKKRSDDEMDGKQLVQADISSASPHGSQDEKVKSDISEIIVTAQKRVERLQDVPVPVTSVNPDRLIERNQLRIQDYFTSVPGLRVVPSIQSNQTLSIRGITTGIGNPTVGVTVDGVPYGASTNNGGGRIVPDIDPGDLDRIEVLRGPQGTLYGASSLGGLMNFVTRDPSTEAFSGRIQAGTSSVHNGDELGYNVRGSVNVPLGDTLAFRASAFTRRDAGYVDNLQTGESGVNRVDAHGGRLSAMWKPSDGFSLKLAALLQQVEGHGTSSVDPVLGDLRQSRLPGSGWYDRKAQAYSATLAAALGSVDLTAISGYSINSFSDSIDASFAFSGQAQTLFGVPGAQLLSGTEIKKLSQEIRFSGSGAEKFDWLFGMFYTDEDSESPAFRRVAVNPATGAIVGTMLNAGSSDPFEEYAAFANLTFHVTERFDVQVGGRQSEIQVSRTETTTNAQGVQTIVPEFSAEGSAFTYLITPRFKISPDLMVYARLASGYRAGGPNAFAGGVVPSGFDPDTTRNYEIGVKGAFLERMLSVDASLYYIDWSDLQFATLSPAATTYFTNGSGAKSQGVEISVESQLPAGVTLAGWVAWSEAELTEAFPPGSTVYGVPGNRLPDSSRFSGSLSADRDFPLWKEVEGFVGISVSYVGDRVGPFRGAAAGVPLARQTFPAYTQADLRAGLKTGAWTANIFVTNLGDERSALYGGFGALPATAFSYIQPRTLGLSLSRVF